MSLEDFANRIAHQRLLRHLLFLAAAILSITIIGYHFGTFDQAIHIPFLKAGADPSLYPGDAFIALRQTQYSFFWFAFWPFYLWGHLEVTLFAVHLLAIYLTFWAAWSLSLTLFKDALAGLVGMAAFVFPHIGFLGFPVIEFSLLNRTFVLPFLLFAINLYLQKRYLAAFLLLGLMTNLHALSANLVTAMLIFVSLVEIRRVGIAKVFQGAGLFLIAAAPVLLMKANSSQLGDWSLRPEWLSIVARGVLSQIFYPFTPTFYVLLPTICGFCAVGLFLVAHGVSPAPHHERTICLMLIAAFLIFGVGVFTAQVLPVTILIESQVNRVGLFILIFAYLHFANYLVREYRARRMNQASFVLLAGTFYVSAFPIFPLAVWGLLRRLKPGRLNMGWTTTGIIGSIGFCVPIAIGVAGGLWQPGIHVFARQTAWYEVQRWARDHTPPEAVFITPPEKWWLFEPEWRVFSERSTLVELSDLLEVALAPQYLNTWLARFNTLAPGAVEQFNGNIYDSVRLTRQAYYSLTDQALLQAACTYQAEYLVIEKPHTRNFPLLYENQRYIIYSLDRSLCSSLSYFLRMSLISPKVLMANIHCDSISNWRNSTISTGVYVYVCPSASKVT